MSAQRNEQFGDKAYWDQRYADPNEPDFDWFQSYDNLKYVSPPSLPPSLPRSLARSLSFPLGFCLGQGKEIG